MSCEHCAKAVAQAAGKLPGVEELKVDLKGGTVSFRFDPARSPLKNIAAAIVDAGYAVPDA
jgi:copper chaperone